MTLELLQEMLRLVVIGATTEKDSLVREIRRLTAELEALKADVPSDVG